jgi:hypothetical protein
VADLAGRAVTVIAVTGMHRSGTSLLAGVVQLLGVGFGRDEALLPATVDNPKGYFENERIVQFDDAFLGHLGGWWHVPPELAGDWAYEWEMEPFRVWAAQLVADHLSSAPVNGFKDPRVSLLLPFWRTVVDVERTIHSVRHPEAVAASLRVRDGFGDEHSAFLWLRYVLGAVHHDPGRLDVFYDDWFQDPAALADRVSRHLGLGRVLPATLDRIEGFVSPGLRRQDGGEGSTAARGELMHHAVELFERLRAGDIAAEELAALHERFTVTRAPETA